MDACFLTYFRNDGSDPAGHDLLWIRLARIDHVVDSNAAAKLRACHWRLLFCIWIGRRYPQWLPIRIVAKQLVVKIESQFTELPQLVGNVLSCVGHSAIRTHNDLVRLVLVSTGMRLKRHDPTACMSSLTFESDNTRALH